MLGNLAKRAVELAILFLAAVTFFLVPFGSRTLFQHCKAIFTTEPAAELGREIEKKGREVVTEVKKEVAPSSTVAPIAPHEGSK
jgi:hypothetical protein